MILPYIALAVTGMPAAYRTRAFLRAWIAWEVVMTVALKLAWHFWRVYDPPWRIAEPVGIVLAASAVLKLSAPRKWPFYVFPAVVVHGWSFQYPNRWPGSWLQLEIHLVAFASLVLGLYVLSSVAEGRQRNGVSLPVSILLLSTAASFYPMPWQMNLRIPLMYWQSVLYVWIAFSAKPQTKRIPPQSATR